MGSLIFFQHWNQGGSHGEAISALAIPLWWTGHVYRDPSPCTPAHRGHLDADPLCQLEPWRPKDSGCQFLHRNKVLSRRGLLLPDPCPLTHRRGQKLETAGGAQLSSGLESYNDKMVRGSSTRTALQLSPGPDTGEIQKRQPRLLSNMIPPLWEHRLTMTYQAPSTCQALCSTIAFNPPTALWLSYSF